ncbi:MFS transporter [Nonomuraea glycinis]|uniref:MFS transporter n=1 Tax=Nonomuraea glycinis TaxID=2047744 RepID=A0A918E561_9ACTN|nr:MFS transporter [Nonomuraea glycinis]MCA2175757.1 MFS transporter [Nonomuraea glycinis]GGP05312.1 MFS transporter [Nonomuraea glycinis]
MHTLAPRERLPKGIRLLIVARAVNRLGAFSLSFLTVLISTDFGVSAATAGLVSAAFGLATVPSRLFGGYLADRLGRRRTILLGLTGCAVAQLGIAAAGSLPVIAVFAVLLGLVFELYEPPSQAMIADDVPAADRTRAYSLLNAALAAAGMGAGLIAASVGRWDLRWLFVVDALTCLACAVIIGLVVPPDGPRRGRATSVTSSSAWRDPALLAMLGCGTLLALIYMVIMILLPLTLPEYGLRAADAGLLFTVSALTIIAGQPLLRLRPVAALPPAAGLAAGAAFMAAGLAGYALAPVLPALAVATVVWSVGDLLIMGRAYAVVAGIAPPDARGRYLAVFGTSWGFATVAAPLAGTQLLERLGAQGLWACLAGACLVLAAASVSVGRLIGPSAA